MKQATMPNNIPMRLARVRGARAGAGALASAVLAGSGAIAGPTHVHVQFWHVHVQPAQGTQLHTVHVLGLGGCDTFAGTFAPAMIMLAVGPGVATSCASEPLFSSWL